MERATFGKAPDQGGRDEVDENGDAIFRFSLSELTPADALSLEGFYRAHLRDLLQIVRLYAGDHHVIVDGFAFADRPGVIMPILPLRGPDAGAGSRRTPPSQA